MQLAAVDLDDISIHAAREGGDTVTSGHSSTVYSNISIHAAREGGDLVAMLADTATGYFNPRRP